MRPDLEGTDTERKILRNDIPQQRCLTGAGHAQQRSLADEVSRRYGQSTGLTVKCHNRETKAFFVFVWFFFFCTGCFGIRSVALSGQNHGRMGQIDGRSS